MPTLATEALALGHRHARNAELRERGSYLIELERLDDRGDEFISLPYGNSGGSRLLILALILAAPEGFTVSDKASFDRACAP